jgi:hypothetical protein
MSILVTIWATIPASIVVNIVADERSPTGGGLAVGV